LTVFFESVGYGDGFSAKILAIHGFEGCVRGCEVGEGDRRVSFTLSLFVSSNLNY